MHHYLKYCVDCRKQKSHSDVLVMTILCRNEVDIIEANVRVHASLGVDAFIIMDNGSTDGTRELVSALAEEFQILIIDQTDYYQQAKWQNEMIAIARKKLNASWVISNDADEFYLPDSGAIKDYLKHSDSIVSLRRSNMLLTQKALENSYRFFDTIYRVSHPICYDRQAELSEQNVVMFFANISPKVIINPRGIKKIVGGNHRGQHIAKKYTGRTETQIRVYHYPIRDYDQFEAHIKHRKELLKQNAKMGSHYRRWVRLLDEGELYNEFEKFIVSDSDLVALSKYGVVTEDVFPSQTIQQVLKENC